MTIRPLNKLLSPVLSCHCLQQMLFLQVYKRLQVHDLFDAYACDLTGISETPLYVSHFNHKAHITVNEHGNNPCIVHLYDETF